MGVHDEVWAYWFDRAVSVFGSAVEAELHEAATDAKDQSQANRKQALVLNKWLTMPDERKFRDPAEMLRKR